MIPPQIAAQIAAAQAQSQQNGRPTSIQAPDPIQQSLELHNSFQMVTQGTGTFYTLLLRHFLEQIQNLRGQAAQLLQEKMQAENERVKLERQLGEANAKIEELNNRIRG
jgi:phage shock protein A